MKDLMLFIIALCLGIAITACVSNTSDAKTPAKICYPEGSLKNCERELAEVTAAYENLQQVMAKERADREQNAAIKFKKVTRGFRNMNPMNVVARGSKDPWYGQVGKDKDGYAKFETYQHGIRAGYITLRHYAKEHKVTTLVGLAQRYCKSDANKYAKFLGVKLGVKANQKIDLLDYMPELLMAIIEMENGECPFPAEWFVAYKR